MSKGRKESQITIFHSRSARCKWSKHRTIIYPLDRLKELEISKTMGSWLTLRDG